MRKTTLVLASALALVPGCYDAAPTAPELASGANVDAHVADAATTLSTLFNRGASKCLEAGQLHAVIAACSELSRQQWLVPDVGVRGDIRTTDDQCLTARRQKRGGRILIVRSCRGSGNQQWRLTESGRLKGIGGKCVDLEDGGTADGTRLVMRRCRGTQTQLWDARAADPGEPTDPVVTGVEVAPATATLAQGAQQAFTAEATWSDGRKEAAEVAWSATGGTISAAGLYTAGQAAGIFQVIGELADAGMADTAEVTITTVEPPPPPPDGSSGDPSRLPVASRQLPAFASYPGRALRSGGSYTDPVTGARVWKVTDASTPSANGTGYHDYGSGSVQASRDWGSGRHTIAVMATNWLVDFTSGSGLSNWRRGPDVNSDLSFTFSMNAATPRIAYYVSGTTIRRYNTASNADEPAGLFPRNLATEAGSSPFLWLQQDRNDRWFVMMSSNHSRIVAWNSATDQVRVLTPARVGYGIDEPHLERDGRYVMVSLNTSGSRDWLLWDLETDTFTAPISKHVHPAAVRSGFMSMDPDVSEGPQWTYDPTSRSLTRVLSASELSPDPQHRGDQWIQSDADLGGDLMRQWVLWSGYNDGLASAGAWALESGQIYRASVSYGAAYEKPEIGVRSVRQYVTGDASRAARQLTQASSVATMTEGSFYFDAGANRIYVWAVGGGSPGGRVALRAPGTVHDGIGFVRLDGSEVRLLAHHYSVDVSDYYHQPHATISPDGLVVLFDSNMNDSNGRGDLFLVEVPAR